MADIKMSVFVSDRTHSTLKDLAKGDRRTLSAYVSKLLDAHAARKGEAK